ncbi:MAG: hypothetical protein ACO4AJ_04850, partial [Prochlorothrix sp.]
MNLSKVWEPKTGAWADFGADLGVDPGEHGGDDGKAAIGAIDRRYLAPSAIEWPRFLGAGVGA